MFKFMKNIFLYFSLEYVSFVSPFCMFKNAGLLFFPGYLPRYAPCEKNMCAGIFALRTYGLINQSPPIIHQRP